MNQIKCRLTKNQLLSKGFRFSRAFSDDKNEVYTYRFPVYKYEKMIILECELRVLLGEDEIYINVYDYNTNDRYAPFYYCEYGNYNRMLKEINGKIKNELKKLQIVETQVINNTIKEYYFEAGF